MNPIVHSMRLRTLPLSLSGVLCGVFLAFADFHLNQSDGFSWISLPFLLLTTVCLQILSNLSNELGDHLSGTDGAGREGPMYSLGEGKITVAQFKRVIAVFVALCCLFGSAMTWCVFDSLFCFPAIVMLVLGACAIWAAMHYTLGKHPYGYRGMGDLFVFIFFGLVSVLGGYWVMTGEMVSTGWYVLPAGGIGLFSIGVLNVNNIRDMQSDAGTRATIPLRIGEHRAKVYHTFLIVGGWVCFLLFTFFAPVSSCHLPLSALYLLLLPVYVLHLVGVWKRTGKALDPMLPMLVISTFLLSLLLGFGLLF